MKLQATPETLKLLAKTGNAYQARVLSVAKNGTVVVETADEGAHVLTKAEVQNLGKLTAGDVIVFSEDGTGELQAQEKKQAGRPRGSGCSYAQLGKRAMS